MKFSAAMILEVKRRLIDESIPGLHNCLPPLKDEKIWLRLNPHSNSTGNMVIQLYGKTSQWLGTGLGDISYKGNWQAEFEYSCPAYWFADLTFILVDEILEGRNNTCTEDDGQGPFCYKIYEVYSN